MAITAGELALINILKITNSIPHNPRIVQLGEANWYGDMPFEHLEADIRRLNPDLIPEYYRAVSRNDIYAIADVFWKLHYQPSVSVSIDLHGTERALKIDLNYPIHDHPIADDPPFDIVINNGTAEHVWNQHQFFKTAHALCKTNGLMTHALPMRGWLNHGFYIYNPIFVMDLAAANSYDLITWHTLDMPSGKIRVLPKPTDRKPPRQEYFSSLKGDVLLFVALRKTNDDVFLIPQQGHYSGEVTAEKNQEWISYRSKG